MSNEMPQAGDTVRVVLEGKVRRAGMRHFTMGEAGVANAITPSGEHVKSIEVIARPLQVGWHKVIEEVDSDRIWARYWTGTEWSRLQDEPDPHGAVEWTSVQYLGP